MSLVSNEKVKLSAAYLDTAAGGLLTAGVVAPRAAVAFGWAVALSALRASRTDP